jgi:hypothetical protein
MPGSGNFNQDYDREESIKINDEHHLEEDGIQSTQERSSGRNVVTLRLEGLRNQIETHVLSVY